MCLKKERERWVLDIFLKLYKEGELIVLCELERPDFMVGLNQKKIGIELTEIFQDSHLRQSKLKQASSEAGSLTRDFIALLQPYVPFSFSIGIGFHKYRSIKGAKKKVILDELKEICYPKMLELSEFESLRFENFRDGLPTEIESLSIVRLDKDTESFDSQPEGGVLPKLTLQDVKNVLSRKEKKLSNYKLCDEQWLVIREGNYFSGSFSEVDIEVPIESLFDHVFLLRTSKNEIIKLK